MSTPHAAAPLVRAAGIVGPLGFAVGVVAAVQLTAAGAPLAAAAAAFAALAAFAVMAWSMRVSALDGRERLPTPERARLRFQTFNALWVVLFVLSFVFAEPLARAAPHPAMGVAMRAVPVLALAVLVVEFVRMIALSDEMERLQHLTACASAGGGLVALSTLWSVLQASAPGLPALEGWMLLPAFAVAYALAMTLIQQGRA